MNGTDVYVLPVEQQRALEFYVDRGLRVVHARGPEPLVTQFAALVDALDAGSQPGQKTRALHVERTAPEQLQEAVDAYRGRIPATPSPAPNANDQSSNVPVPTSSPVRLVNYLQQATRTRRGRCAAARRIRGRNGHGRPECPGTQ